MTCKPVASPVRASCIAQYWDEAEGEVRQTYESPFTACLESARVRLKEGSQPSIEINGWARPFPRTGCAPSAMANLTRGHLKSQIAGQTRASDGDARHSGDGQGVALSRDSRFETIVEIHGIASVSRTHEYVAAAKSLEVRDRGERQ